MPSMQLRPALATLLWAVGICAALPATERSHDEIKRLRDAGEILPLETIISRHQRQHPGGRLLEVELEYEHSRYVYELKILGTDGVVREFEYDARTGELWAIERQRKR